MAAWTPLSVLRLRNSSKPIRAFAHTSIMMKRGEFDLYLSINASARTPSGATASGLLRVE